MSLWFGGSSQEFDEIQKLNSNIVTKIGKESELNTLSEEWLNPIGTSIYLSIYLSIYI
jgi:hypothetical protein